MLNDLMIAIGTAGALGGAPRRSGFGKPRRGSLALPIWNNQARYYHAHASGNREAARGYARDAGLKQARSIHGDSIDRRTAWKGDFNSAKYQAARIVPQLAMPGLGLGGQGKSRRDRLHAGACRWPRASRAQRRRRAAAVGLRQPSRGGIDPPVGGAFMVSVIETLSLL